MYVYGGFFSVLNGWFRQGGCAVKDGWKSSELLDFYITEKLSSAMLS
jgi:hypothetical protein